jgi:hypothetical protein
MPSDLHQAEKTGRNADRMASAEVEAEDEVDTIKTETETEIRSSEKSSLAQSTTTDNQ